MPRSTQATQATQSPSTERDVLGSIALAAAVVSAIGYLRLIIGHAVDPTGFNNGKHPNTANNIAFFAFVVGLLIALFLGGASYVFARRAGHTSLRSRAAIGFLAGVGLLVLAVISAALGG